MGANWVARAPASRVASSRLAGAVLNGDLRGVQRRQAGRHNSRSGRQGPCNQRALSGKQRQTIARKILPNAKQVVRTAGATRCQANSTCSAPLPCLPSTHLQLPLRLTLPSLPQPQQLLLLLSHDATSACSSKARHTTAIHDQCQPSAARGAELGRSVLPSTPTALPSWLRGNQ